VSALELDRLDLKKLPRDATAVFRADDAVLATEDRPARHIREVLERFSR
jgi:hypothetical protein